MQPPTEARIADWETRPADDGYAGLHALAESGFSGVITASRAALFVLNGRAIGLVGTIESFEDAPLTAHTAPHPAVPLLLAMEEQENETRATYYTNDTPIDETATTLESGGFTGYIELSENVLSGDYFRVYHQGRSMCVGFVGSNERLITGEDAESRMREEVGIYTVEAVDIDEIAIPGPSSRKPSTTPDEPAETAEHDVGGEPTISDATDHPSAMTASTADDSNVSARNEVAEPDPDPSSTDPVLAESDPASIDATSEDGTEIPPPEPPASDAAESAASGESATANEPATTEPDQPTDPRDRWGSVIDDPVEDRIAAEQQWRETTHIPSIDPERSTAAPTASETTESAAVETAEPEPSEEVLDALETEREARQAAERTVAELEEEIERLEERLSATEDDAQPSETELQPEPESTTGPQLDPPTVLSGTNLFVRYASKGAATLETAHAGETDRESLAGNLRLERRTAFDSTNATVGDETFEAFLTDRLEYRFAEWVVRELPFELAETGHASSLSALYDALPAIDRIELRGTIEGEEGTRTFDVVCRNRMGEPLFVVDCADTRAAVTEGTVATLVGSATETKDVAPDLAGAMLVTTSYFDPGALSTAEEATQSGLLGGGARESYVTISRRNGYHLCLVEMHHGTFHVTVPEL